MQFSIVITRVCVSAEGVIYVLTRSRSEHPTTLMTLRSKRTARRLVSLVLMLALFFLNEKQATSDPRSQAAQPVRTVTIGKAKIYYYHDPEAVAATATFYVAGSSRTSLYKNFLAVTVHFENRGNKLTKPSVVQLTFVATTYRDGCRCGNSPQLTISADKTLLVSTDLTRSAVHDKSGTKYGCVEIYDFHISFDEFIQLADAKEVRIRLGPAEGKLKEDHLSALRSMRSNTEP